MQTATLQTIFYWVIWPKVWSEVRRLPWTHLSSRWKSHCRRHSCRWHAVCWTFFYFRNSLWSRGLSVKRQEAQICSKHGTTLFNHNTSSSLVTFHTKVQVSLDSTITTTDRTQVRAIWVNLHKSTTRTVITTSSSSNFSCKISSTRQESSQMPGSRDCSYQASLSSVSLSSSFLPASRAWRPGTLNFAVFTTTMTSRRSTSICKCSSSMTSGSCRSTAEASTRTKSLKLTGWPTSWTWRRPRSRSVVKSPPCFSRRCVRVRVTTSDSQMRTTSSTRLHPCTKLKSNRSWWWPMTWCTSWGMWQRSAGMTRLRRIQTRSAVAETAAYRAIMVMSRRRRSRRGWTRTIWTSCMTLSKRWKVNQVSAAVHTSSLTTQEALEWCQVNSTIESQLQLSNQFNEEPEKAAQAQKNTSNSLKISNL